jgi:hypothetical protein
MNKQRIEEIAKSKVFANNMIMARIQCENAITQALEEFKADILTEISVCPGNSFTVARIRNRVQQMDIGK